MTELQERLPEDFEWALDRVTRMCASALVDAQVYRQKLLKGFGYPNETFARAQDYRALKIVLDALAALSRSQPAPRFAWLLEKSIDDTPAYWDGGHAESFTRDPNRAVQFCRKEDALLACKPQHYAPWGWNYIEHGFMEDRAALSRSPVESRTKVKGHCGCCGGHEFTVYERCDECGAEEVCDRLVGDPPPDVTPPAVRSGSAATPLKEQP